jgi:hypothetical protein
VLALALGLASTRALDGAGAAPVATPSAGSPNLGKQMLLRLHDLPPGYLLLDFGSSGQGLLSSECARIRPRKPMPRLASFLERYSPRGCVANYVRIFHVPGSGPAPLIVGSAAADLGSVEAAEAGLAVSRELLTRVANGELPEEVKPPEIVGDATRIFHWPDSDSADSEEPLSMVVWRWGDSIGLIVVLGGDFATGDSAALEFARRQQKHLEAPTPYTPAERDDTEVALEDPALQVPVYWLGRTFAPGQGFARLRLGGTSSTAQLSLHRPHVSVFYADRLSSDRAEVVELDSWAPRQWKAHIRKKGLPFEQHCAKTRELDLPGGRAVIYAGLHPGWRCDQRGPKVHTAVIRLPGVVVTAATMKVCKDCFGPGKGPYNSFRGMATIARGLALR